MSHEAGDAEQQLGVPHERVENALVDDALVKDVSTLYTLDCHRYRSAHCIADR